MVVSRNLYDFTTINWHMELYNFDSLKFAIVYWSYILEERFEHSVIAVDPRTFLHVNRWQCDWHLLA